MKKIFFVFSASLMLILAILFWSAWQKSNFSNTESLKNIIQKLRNVSPQNNESAVESQYQEFTNSDGEFKIKYPADWSAINSPEILTALTPLEWAEKYDLRTLFLAQDFTENSFIQLIVYEGNFDISAKEIIEEIKKNNQKQGWSVKIIESDVGETETTFEASYARQGSPNLYSKEKILVVGRQAYLISLIAPEEKWQDFAQEANLAINSAAIDKNAK